MVAGVLHLPFSSTGEALNRVRCLIEYCDGGDRA